MYDPDIATRLKILPDVMRNMESNLKDSVQKIKQRDVILKATERRAVSKQQRQVRTAGNAPNPPLSPRLPVIVSPRLLSVHLSIPFHLFLSLLRGNISLQPLSSQ